MKPLNFHSSLKKILENFVELRRLTGTNYQSQIQLLEYFDLFLVKQNFNTPRLNKDIIQRYLASISHLSQRGRYNRFSVVRQLGQYLSQFDSLSYVPESIPTGRSGQSLIPYIFSKTEIQSLLEYASKLEPQKSLRPHTYHTLIGLIYSTGLRISEAMSLNIGDLYSDSKLLHIREGKFRKERWVPLSATTFMVLKRYLLQRQNMATLKSDFPLMINLKHKRLRHRSAHQTFRDLLGQSNIHIGKGPGPRIHDLRHTFAVHRLLEWYRDGQDINARLPALATYMGHAHISSTQIYLKATPELFEAANTRFLKYYRDNIKNEGE